MKLRLSGFQRRLLLAAAALLASGCMVMVHPHPRLLSPQEAVNAATWFVRSRGLTVDETRYMRLDHHGRWHVRLAGAGGRDQAQVVLDGYSGRVLSARLRGLHAPPGPPPAEEQEPEQGPEEQAPPAKPPTAAPKELPPPPPASPPPPPTK